MKKKLITVLLMALWLISITVGCNTNPYVYNAVYKNDDAYSIGNFTYKAEAVKEVHINWAFGDVSVLEDDGDTLMVSESNNNLIDDQRLRYLIENGILTIQFCKSGYHGDFKGVEKKLTVKIPKGIKLEIESLSANVNVSDSDFSELDIEVSSGTVDVRNITVSQEFSVETSSGQIDLTKITARSIDIESSSGKVKLIESLAQNDIELDIKSGNVEISETTSLSIDAESSSGKIKMYKVNAPTIEAETSSGMVRLESITTLNAILKSISGEVHADLLDCSSININTSSGAVYLNLNGLGLSSLNYKTNSGELNLSDSVQVINGKVTATIKTSSGNINID